LELLLVIALLEMSLQIITVWDRAMIAATWGHGLVSFGVHLHQTQYSAANLTPATDADLARCAMLKKLLHLGASNLSTLTGIDLARARVNEGAQEDLEASLALSSLVHNLLALGLANFLVDSAGHRNGREIMVMVLAFHAPLAQVEVATTAYRAVVPVSGDDVLSTLVA